MCAERRASVPCALRCGGRRPTTGGWIALSCPAFWSSAAGAPAGLGGPAKKAATDGTGRLDAAHTSRAAGTAGTGSCSAVQPPEPVAARPSTCPGGESESRIASSSSSAELVLDSWSAQLTDCGVEEARVDS